MTLWPPNKNIAGLGGREGSDFCGVAGKLQHLLLPLRLFKTSEYKSICNYQRALYQHAVRGKKGQLLLFIHLGQLVLQ